MNKAVKGMSRDMVCRDQQFAAGETYNVTGKIQLGELALRAVEWVLAKCKPAKGGGLNVEDFKLASNSAYRGAASNSGLGGVASNTGDGGAASNSAYHGAASNSAYRGAASNSGLGGVASNTGDGGAAVSHARFGKVKGDVPDTVLYCTEIDENGKIVSCAKGITGKGKTKCGIWYCCQAGKLVPAT